MAVKDTVLSVLQNVQSADGFISGQELAEKCGVTRTSVWKAVEALRKEGADIEAVTNRGYRLTESNIFNQKSVSELIDDKTVEVKFFDVIDSTNTQAKRDLNESSGKKLHKRVYVASKQTAGRGRLGRAFFSPENCGVYLSIIYFQNPITKPALFTATASVAVCRAIKKIYDVDAKIKWVNDVYVNGAKVCGILTEGIANFETGLIESAVIGIGVNILKSENLPPELQNVAGSIVSGKSGIKRSEFAAQIVNEIIFILDGGNEKIKEAMKEYKERSILIGRNIEFSPVINQEEKMYSCQVVDITEDAKLVVKMPDGEIRSLESGEISIHSKLMV